MNTSAAPLIAESTPKGLRLAVFSVIVALFLAAMDSTVIAVLLPIISHALGRPALYPWLMSGFLLTVTLVAPLTGTLADRYGAARMLQVGIAIFLLASVGAALSSSMSTMILARAGQGVGGGMIMVLSYTLLGIIFGPEQRGKMQGLLSGVWGLAAIMGPAIGVGVSAWLGWRYVFLLNVPIALACMTALHFTRQGQRISERRTHDPLDLTSHIAFGVIIVGIMLLLSQQSIHLTSASLLILASTLLLSLLMLITRVASGRGVIPIPTAFLKQGELFATLLLVIFSSAALYGSVTLLPLYLHKVGVGDAGTSGAVVTAAALGWVAGSAICGSRLKHLGFRFTALLGSLMLLGGAAILSADTTLPSLPMMMGAEALIGAGIGFVATTTLVLAQNGAPDGRIGSYTATIQLLRNMGAALGVNALAAVQLQAGASEVASYHVAFLALALLMVLCVPLAFILPGNYLLNDRSYI